MTTTERMEEMRKLLKPVMENGNLPVGGYSWKVRQDHIEKFELPKLLLKVQEEAIKEERERLATIVWDKLSQPMASVVVGLLTQK